MKLIQIAQPVLAHRKLAVVLAIVAFMLALPSLWTGWIGDDHIHEMTMRGFPDFPELVNSPWDVFILADGNAARNRNMMDIGVFPWWTYENLHFAFFRPLSAASRLLDQFLWPESAALAHLQNVFWKVSLVIAVIALYRRLITPLWVAGLAALLYTIDDSHSLSTAWLANRHLLLSTFWGVLSIVSHDCWIRSKWKPGAFFGAGCLMLALLSAESGLAAVAYLVSYNIFLSQGKWRERLVTLFPYATVVVIWAVTYYWAGFGVEGSGMYIDPIRSPFTYVGTVIERYPIFIMGQWGFPPSDSYIFFTEQSRLYIWTYASLFLLLMLCLLIPVLRKDAVARFFALGMGLTLFPICATEPMDRLLLFTGLGAMGLLAQFLGALVDKAFLAQVSRKWRRLAQGIAIYLTIVHLLFAPPLALIRTYLQPMLVEFPHAEVDKAVPLDSTIEKQTLVFVNPPSALFTIYLSFVRSERGLPAPAYVRSLASGTAGLKVYRVDERTLKIQPQGGFIGPIENAYRGEDYPMQVGQVVELTGLTIQVTEVMSNGHPAEALFRFDVPLEDPSLRWFMFNDEQGYVDFVLPQVGETTLLPPVWSKY